MKKKQDDEHRLYNRNFRDACKNAFNGIIYGVKSQRNIRIQLVMAVIIIIIGFIAKLNTFECIVLTFAIFLVIIAEMINTAIETAIDLYTQTYHPKAKLAKDAGAGAVVLAAINALIVAYFLFFDRIVAWITSLIK